MVFNAGIPLSRLWIAAAIGLWVVLLFVGLGFYTPTLRDQLRVLESEGPGGEEYGRLAARGRSLGILLGVIVVAIVFLMVVKPA
jgi:uncharacterized membrane protein